MQMQMNQKVSPIQFYWNSIFMSMKFTMEKSLVYASISACIGRVDVIRCSLAEDIDAMLSEIDEKLMSCTGHLKEMEQLNERG